MPNVVDKLREFFDAPVPGQTIEEFLDNANAMGIKPGGSGSLMAAYEKTMTSTEFIAYLEEKGWHRGTWKYTEDGVEYTLGSDTSFGLFNYPQSSFSAERIHVVSDSESVLTISGTPTFLNGRMNYTIIAALAKDSKDELYFALGPKWLSILKLTPIGFVETPAYLQWIVCQTDNISHQQGMDVRCTISFTFDSISIHRGKYYPINTSNLPTKKTNPRISLGSAVLDEEKLTALLALLDGGSLPSVTSEDNGDVLTVVEGAWAKSDSVTKLQNELNATGQVCDYTMHGKWTHTYNEQTDDYIDSYEADMTFAEVYNAIAVEYKTVRLVLTYIEIDGGEYVSTYYGTITPNSAYTSSSIPFIDTHVDVYEGIPNDPYARPSLYGTLSKIIYNDDGSFELPTAVDAGSGYARIVEVTVNGNTYTMDCPAGIILRDLEALSKPRLHWGTGSGVNGYTHYAYVVSASYKWAGSGSDYKIVAFDGDGTLMVFTASSRTDYPTYTAS